MAIFDLGMGTGSLGVGTNYGYDDPNTPTQQAGTWTIPGTNIRLPEFNITEKVFAAEETPSGSTTTGGRGGAGGGGGAAGGDDVVDVSRQTNKTPSGSYNFNIGDFSNYAGWDPNAAYQDWVSKGKPSPGGSGSGGGVDLNSQLRSQIEGGYNDYLGQLEGMYGGLNTQAASQEQIAQNSYQQSVRDLLANRQSGMGDLDVTGRKIGENQVKNLRGIADNIQNQYMAGNVMLGARGAGDSSAANQYSYALNRLGSKERGNVMNQTSSAMADVEAQKAKLNNIVTQETSRLDTELSNVKQSISSWLAEQQNGIRQMIAQGRLNKSQEIASLTQNLLNQAISAYQTKQQEVANKRSSLESWAMSNAQNIQQLTQNMQSIGQFSPQMASARNLNGSVTMDAQGNIRGLYGYGTSDEDKNNYFG